ncbi:MAG: hypothetical protein KAR35_11380 [Candidatus Heimdallarchaeota archaeon]|nr:hypothetical protein [Candidatus Heimdallarchaeota archaeon]MCK5049962.1 hypothetical protein [Candidatus Heimdallarchaeota archaeon]
MNKEEKKEIQDDISRFRSIETMANSNGGKIILKEIKSDVVSTIDQLSTRYGELTHIELIALCAGLKEKLTMMRVMKNAKENKAMAIEALDD